MFSTSDTIVAIATPPGRGGIGIVRLSGPDAHEITRRLMGRDAALVPRHATLATIRSREREARSVSRTASQVDTAIDQAIVTYFPAPASYTGDDVIEISAHGSPVVLKAIVCEAIAGGARLAGPGEFTLRAFLNGRIDLAQAEAVGDLIDAATPLQARAAFDQLNGTLTEVVGEIDRSLFDLIARLEASVDFPEEGYHFVDPGALAASIDAILDRTAALLREARRGRLLREGLQIAIVGEPNVGKSSLFNALVGAARAIVTEIPGTTRDLVTETIDLDGLRVTLVDTAGLRQTEDVVESEGVSRSRRALDVADLILLVCDSSRPLSAEFDRIRQSLDNKEVIVSNKADLPRAWSRPDALEVSATTGIGLDRLRQRIADALDIEPLVDRPEITNVRHAALVERAHVALGRARRAALADGQSMSEEFVLADLQEARGALEEIAGRRAPEDLLAHIFARFCIGK